MTTNQKGAAFGISLLVVAGLISLLVYKAIEPVDREGLRQLFVLLFWLMIILLVSGIALTRWLSVRELRAHEHGMDKGLDKVASMAERVATTRTNLITNIRHPAPAWPAPASPAADYLPRPALRFNRSSSDDEPDVL